MPLDRPRVLIVAPAYYAPEHSSGFNKIHFNLIKFQRHVDYGYLYLCDAIPDRELFDHIPHYPVRQCEVKRKVAYNKIHTLVSGRLYIQIDPIDLHALVRKLVDIIDLYDVIHLSTLQLAPVLDEIPQEYRAKVILCPIDSLALYYHSRGIGERNLLLKILWRRESRKALEFEKKYYSMVKRVLFVSSKDLRFVAEAIGRTSKLETIPVGIDLKAFFNDPAIVRSKNQLLFVGNYNYAPNRAAAKFLYQSLFPELKKVNKNLELILAGANPTPEMLKLPLESGVKVTGFVDNLNALYNSCALFLSPIPFGAGINIKVLEAMSAGALVIGSPTSFDGLDCKNEVHYRSVYGTEVSGWKKEVCRSLACEEGEIIGHRAADYVKHELAWNRVCERYYRSYTKLLGASCHEQCGPGDG